MVPYAKKSKKRRYESPYAEQELGKVLSLVKAYLTRPKEKNGDLYDFTEKNRTLP